MWSLIFPSASPEALCLYGRTDVKFWACSKEHISSQPAQFQWKFKQPAFTADSWETKEQVETLIRFHLFEYSLSSVEVPRVAQYTFVDNKYKFFPTESIVCTYGLQVWMDVPYFDALLWHFTLMLYLNLWTYFELYFDTLLWCITFGILVVCDFALVFALAPISPLFCHFFALALNKKLWDMMRKINFQIRESYRVVFFTVPP